VQLNAAARELVVKVVYYGPGLSGKTTNLQQIHARLAAEVRGRLLSVETHDDRTLFFDLLPVFFESQQGLKVKIKLYTVPGQVIHQATRKLVLQNADAVAFIANSQRNATAENNEYWANLQANLKDNGLEPDEIPVVIQFNKLDLPGAQTEADLAEVRKRGKEPVFGAVAVRGEGVLETLHAVLQGAFRQLDARHGISSRLNLSEEQFLAGVFRNLDLKGTALESLFPAPAQQGAS
jgi:signal recognition particle receptor subunit beta